MRPMRSLVGQTLLVAVLALVFAQGLSAVLLWRAGEERREAALAEALAFQLAAPDPAPRSRMGNDRMRRRFGAGRLPAVLAASRSQESPIQAGEVRSADREQRLAALLAERGVEVSTVEVLERATLDDPSIRQAIERFPRLYDRLTQRGVDRLVVAGVQRPDGAGWRVARVPAPEPDRALLGTILAQTALLVLVLSALLWFALRRIARPLSELSRRTSRFAGAGAAGPPLDPSGPSDVRALIEAHNAMEARIAGMLNEKDVMLGAIGHDLKTPLAALRVRIESNSDPVERARQSAIIAEMRDTLDDILHLARLGRSEAPLETVQLAALAASVADEFDDLGEPVGMGETERVAAPVRLAMIKRALRNLVSNAVRYGGSARVSVLREGEQAVLRVTDEGPGIDPATLSQMVQPFARGEASRNRATGGAGLGLALVKAIAEQHGGTLELANRTTGGLAATIRLPLEQGR